MIAPAMNTRPQETLAYRDLARQQAQISRQIGLEALPRLKELLADVSGANSASDEAAGTVPGVAETGHEFDVVLRFSVDDQGRARVEGELTGAVLLNCHRCAEVLSYPLTAGFSCLIAESEAIADSLVDSLAQAARSRGDNVPTEDVLVANSSEVTVTQIVEDELLLNLPERLCTSEPCERAPELAYPAKTGTEAGAGAGRETGTDGAARGKGAPSTGDDESAGSEDNPFSVLAGLKLDRSSEQ